MFLRKLTLALSLALVAGCSSSSKTDGSSTTDASVPEKDPLEAIAGTYTGEWTLFGVDADGATRTVSHWTDVVTTADPVLQADRTYLSCTDTMTFDGMTQPIVVTWTEGFMLEPDGSVGPRYFEQRGQIVVENQIAPGIFSYAQTATSQELAQLGFTNSTEGGHVTVKVVTTDEGIDTERITRISTVKWTDAAGAVQTTQMTTMQGWHRLSH